MYRLPGRLRLALWGLVFAILGLVVAVIVLFGYVLALKSSRDQQAAREQAQINSAMCSVISQFPAGVSPTLDRVRGQLHCPSTSP